MNIDGCLARNNNYTGWWNITDPQHPEHQTHNVSTSAGVEILTGALHHIATLQGTNPLSAQEPILPQIEAAVQQGIEIPLHTTPAAAVLPPMAEQTNAGDAAMAASNINIITHNSNGALKGNPPFIFDGNRQLSKKFLLAFQLWRMINKNNDTMKQPYSCVIAALSYMDGPKVDSWKEEQTIHLDNEVGSGTLETDKSLWDDWMEAFLVAFTNTNRRAEAYKELCKLKQQESLDSFFADFKHLVKDADIKLDDHSTIEILKNNMKGALVQAIIRSPNYNPTSNNPWKFKEWEKEARSQHIKWQTAEQYNSNRRKALYQVFGINLNCSSSDHGRPARPNHRTTSQGGYHMDVDVASGRGVQHSEAKKQELMKNNQCFYCEILGHHTKDCCKKAADHCPFNGGCTDNPGKGGPSPPIYNRVNDNTPKLTLSIDEMINFVKDNMDSFNEDTKLGFVSSLMPKDFQMAQN